MTDCPPGLMPRNCRAAVKAAEAGGWKWRCTIAAGFAPEETELTWSVLFRAWKPGQILRLCGRWEGPEKDELSWHSGWAYPNPRPLTWTQLSDELNGNLSKPLTPIAQAKLDLDVAEQLAAIAALQPIADPIAVWPVGANWKCKDGTWTTDCASTCKGATWHNQRGRIPCSKPAIENGVLCDDCTRA